jgi:hypothetical protein
MIARVTALCEIAILASTILHFFTVVYVHSLVHVLSMETMSRLPQESARPGFALVTPPIPRFALSGNVACRVGTEAGGGVRLGVLTSEREVRTTRDYVCPFGARRRDERGGVWRAGAPSIPKS